MTDTSREISDLRLAEFAPRPTLVVEQHEVRRARFPAIDAHNHLGRWLSRDGDWIARDVREVLRVLDACNIAAIVNLDGLWGDELEANLDRYDRAYPDRFITFARVDWDLVTQPDFGPRMARQLEDSVRRGARGLKVWKTLGLRYRDAQGRLIPIDDERLFDLWEATAQQRVPVLIHIADPVAFFQPLDRFNERWEELRRHPDWHFYGPEFPSFEALIEQFERLIARHPRTTFIGAHVGCYAENLTWVGHQPSSSKRLFERHPDRIVFGLDSFPPTEDAYAPYFRFLETADEYFPYSSHGIGIQGRWNIYGIDLPDEVLRQVYHDTAARLIVTD